MVFQEALEDLRGIPEPAQFLETRGLPEAVTLIVLFCLEKRPVSLFRFAPFPGLEKALRPAPVAEGVLGVLLEYLVGKGQSLVELAQTVMQPGHLVRNQDRFGGIGGFGQLFHFREFALVKEYGCQEPDEFDLLGVPEDRLPEEGDRGLGIALLVKGLGFGEQVIDGRGMVTVGGNPVADPCPRDGRFPGFSLRVLHQQVEKFGRFFGFLVREGHLAGQEEDDRDLGKLTEQPVEGLLRPGVVVDKAVEKRTDKIDALVGREGLGLGDCLEQGSQVGPPHIAGKGKVGEEVGLEIQLEPGDDFSLCEELERPLVEAVPIFSRDGGDPTTQNQKDRGECGKLTRAT